MKWQLNVGSMLCVYDRWIMHITWNELIAVCFSSTKDREFVEWTNLVSICHKRAPSLFQPPFAIRWQPANIQRLPPESTEFGFFFPKVLLLLKREEKLWRKYLFLLISYCSKYINLWAHTSSSWYNCHHVFNNWSRRCDFCLFDFNLMRSV